MDCIIKMKTFTFCLLLFATFSIKAQYVFQNIESNFNGINFNLNFTPSEHIQKNGKIFFPQFDDYSKSGQPTLPSHVFYIAIPEKAAISQLDLKIIESTFINNIFISANSSIEIINKDDIAIIDQEMKEEFFNLTQFPKKLARIINYEYIKNYYCAVIEVTPYVYNFNNRTLEEIHSIQFNVKFNGGNLYQTSQATNIKTAENNLSKMILNYDSAKLFEIPINNSYQKPADDWLNYDYNYLKFSINNDNIYRITKNDLNNIGINTNFINPKNLKIYIKGIEIPLNVVGEEDGIFDEQDYIEFYAEKNYESKDYTSFVNKGETYKNYLNRYTDSTVIWLTWDGSEGKRINVQDILPPSSDTLLTSNRKIHLEQDKRIWYYDAVQPRTQLPFYQEHKVWTWYYIPNTANVKIDFNINKLVPNSLVKINARMISHSADIINNAHAYVVAVNGTDYVDTVRFNYTETINFESEFSSNQFNEGANYIRIKSIPTEAKFHQALVDWVDINFNQYNTAVQDSLLIEFYGIIDNKISNVKIGNVNAQNSDIVIYRTEPTVKKIKNIFRIDNNTIVFNDTIYDGSKYLLKTISNINPPKFLENKSFVNLKDNNNSCEYLIISNSLLKEAVTDYANYIQENYGLKVYTAYVNDIYDEFSSGQVGPEPIKEFIKFVYNNWKEPKLKYLLMIGDANYDYKDVVEPAPTIRKKNLVPAFGYPVSDVWYTIFEELNENFQQIYVGRIPASTNTEVERYLTKHKNYNNRKYDLWNKRYLLFSGGDPKKPYELSQIKAANDFIKDNLINPAPIGGLSTHFYKTSDPVTNFGPYTSEKISQEIGEGGMFISYLGHSGTQTWDNGVTSVSDIKSKYSDRYPLITDFGCSTGKFAEPDVDSYSELAISLDQDGEAIIYLGNTSLGYLSSALNFPALFYEQLLMDTLLSIGEVHALAKQKLFQKSGISDITRVFNLCNNLFGDPIIKIKIPDKPNFTIPIADINIPSNISDVNESIELTFKVKNLGKVIDDSVKIKIADYHNSEIVFQSEFKTKIPLYEENINLLLPVFKKLGGHKLELSIDYENDFNEIYEDDNTQSVNYTIYSSSVRPIIYDPNYSLIKDAIKFINPNYNNNNNNLVVKYSQEKNFVNYNEKNIPIDTLVTSMNINDWEADKKYFMQTKLVNEENLSSVYTLKKTTEEYDWQFDNSFQLNAQNLYQTEFDSVNNGWRLTNKLNYLKLTSAGKNEGSFASIVFNSNEVLSNTFFWGIATAIIDPISFEPRDVNFFQGLPREPNEDSLVSYLTKLPDSTLVAFLISDDAAQSVLGFGNGTKSREMIKTFGSFYIDSVRYRESWCMIGKKGAAKGTVPEVYHHLFEGPAVIDSSVLISYNYGNITLPKLNNISSLNRLKIESIKPENTGIDITPIVEFTNGKLDSLNKLVLDNNEADLNFINTNDIIGIKFKVDLISDEPNISPLFKSMSIDYNGIPELAINYQVVNIEKDTLQQGEDVNLRFFVYNVGESTADSFKVTVELIKPDNLRETIFESIVDSLGTEQKKKFNVTYNTVNFNGSRIFAISVDSDNKIRELYEDNNYFSIPFYVIGDTTHPNLSITFNGNDIFDGEYISANPIIKIELNDPSLIPITDTSSVNFYLNNKRIPYRDNPDLNINFSNNNPKVVLYFTPHLEDGEYKLKVFAKDASGNLADSLGMTKTFNVINEAKILNVYNYPNPFEKDTYFTFKLTQIPDEIKIKVFTIAGRLVKEIRVSKDNLNFDLNKIFWDGKDNDGDLLANGVYIYKIIMDVEGKKQDITSKLAIIR